MTLLPVPLCLCLTRAVEAVRVSSIWTVALAVSHVAVPLVQQAFEIETKISLALDVAFPRIFCDSYETRERIYDLTHRRQLRVASNFCSLKNPGIRLSLLSLQIESKFFLFLWSPSKAPANGVQVLIRSRSSFLFWVRIDWHWSHNRRVLVRVCQSKIRVGIPFFFSSSQTCCFNGVIL